MSDLWGRVMNAWNGALAGWAGYDLRALTPQNSMAYSISYGEHRVRVFRYATAWSYYYNSIYDQLNLISSKLKTDERLYKFIRGIVNPVKQENDLLVSYTYRGTIDTQMLTGGSMPLVFDNTRLEDPIKQIIKWSNLDQQLSPYVRDAAVLGDVAWWIVDDPFRRRVRLELVDPARIKLVERDEVGNVKAVVVEYEKDEEPDVARYQPSVRGGMTLQKTRTYVFTLKVTKDTFETFKNGEPFAFYADGNGRLVSSWPNPYGFVPLKLAYYTQGRDGWGQNSFFGTPRRQIDELNDQASIINDSVRNVVVPIVQAINISKKDDITVTREDKDSMAIVYLNGDKAELKPLTVPLDIAAASANRDKLYADLERNMPILALQRIRDKSSLSGVAIEQMFGDAISVIENLRKNLNPALVAALQMAVTVGGIRGYFSGFNENSFDAGEMEMRIGDYPVIDDRLSKGEKVDKLIQVAKLPEGSKRTALTEMGYGEKDVEKIIADDKAEAEERQRQAVRAFGDSVFNDDEEDEDDDAPETEPDEEAQEPVPA